MKKKIFALWQPDQMSILLNFAALSTSKRSFARLLCSNMVAFIILLAPNSAFGQCEDAAPCVSNINDYQCIVSGAVGALMGTKLLYYPGPAANTPQKIIVKTNLQFNVPYRFFDGSEIILLPGAILSIGSDFATLGNVTIRGCGDRWSDIRVFSNGTFTFEGGEISGGDIGVNVLGGTVNLSGTTIKNSCIGVDLSSGSKAKILGNNFLDNYYGVRVTGNAITLGEGISHNTFEIVSTPPTNCTFSGSPKALQLIDVPYIAFGNQDQTGLPNTIRNYSNGIDATNSNFDLYNSIFRDKVGGTAIDLNGNGGTFSANIFGLGSLESSNALTDNYGSGIEGYNYNLTVQNALLKNGVQMIKVNDAGNNTLPVSINLTNNRIERFGQEGIGCIKAKFNGATIQNNTIVDNLDDFMVSQIRYGIRWQNSTMVSTNKAQILDNTILDNLKTSSPGSSEHWRHFGIQIFHSANINIESNTLTQTYQPNDTRLYEGIGLFAAPFIDVVRNHLVSGGPTLMPDPFFNNEGIYASESGNNSISCNTVEGFYSGISFNGPACDKTQLRSNTIEGDNATGLFLASGTIIGKQSKRNNAWLGNGNTEAFFDGDPDQGAKLASLFTISTSNMNSDFWANPRIPADGWFVPPTTEPTPNPAPDLCYLNPASTPPISGADALVIAGEFQAYKNYPASLWEAQLNAFGTLSKYPEFLTVDSNNLQFYNVHDAGNIGKLSRAIEAWEDVRHFNTSFENTWSNNQSSIVQKLEQIRLKVLEMTQAQTPTQQEQIVQELAVLESSLLAMQQTNQNLSAQYQSDVATRASQLLSDLDNINATEEWETYLKTVLTLMAQNAGSGISTWTTTEQSTLEAIAERCRFAGGIGVVMARAAIEQSDYDDQAMCPGNAERSSKALLLSATLAPNPTSDYCSITFEMPTSATILVSDLQGRVVRMLDINEVYSFIFDTRDLVNGLYLVSIKDSQGRQFLDKMAVLR